MKTIRLFPVSFLLCLLLLPLFSESPLFGEIRTARPHEYLAKAVYIEKIAIFVKWPKQSAIDNKSKPIVLGIIGDSEIKSYFEDIYSTQKKKIKQKPVEIKHFTSPDSITDCHILFITKSMEKDLPRILSTIKDKPVLTIGNTLGYAKKGVHINLFTKGSKVLYEINPSEIRKSLLHVSYHLLKWGKIVKPEPTKT